MDDTHTTPNNNQTQDANKTSGNNQTQKKGPLVDELKDLLKKNRQIILTGAPGTGKTYLARQIARAMTGVSEQETSPRIGFCQFHPSFDYTDFVEGLRPVEKNGSIGFERKDGIFKEFCKKALEGVCRHSYTFQQNSVPNDDKRTNETVEHTEDVSSDYRRKVFNESYDRFLKDFSNKNTIILKPKGRENNDSRWTLIKKSDGCIELNVGPETFFSHVFTSDDICNYWKHRTTDDESLRVYYERLIEKLEIEYDLPIYGSDSEMAEQQAALSAFYKMFDSFYNLLEENVKKNELYQIDAPSDDKKFTFYIAEQIGVKGAAAKSVHLLNGTQTFGDGSKPTVYSKEMLCRDLRWIYREGRNARPFDSGTMSYLQILLEKLCNQYKLPPFPTPEASSIVNEKTTLTGTIESTKTAEFKISNEPYVFIIDEINRGDLSKIFGELFYAIDPDYRGEAGRIKTQYTNLIKKGDVFKEGFYVPDNVYIIGTMNDIDRSVESMDFAIRRRFTWREIKPDDTAEAMLNNAWKTKENKDESIKTALEVMRALNDAMQKNEVGLDAAFAIGGAYFKRLEHFNFDYADLWQFALEPLLREYLRGRTSDEIAQAFKTLRDAYFGARPQKQTPPPKQEKRAGDAEASGTNP